MCKFKAHKRCAVRATNSCKWTTLASIGNDIIEDEDGVSPELPWAADLPASQPPPYLPQGRELDVQTEACPLLLLQVAMPHQWLEGNLPVGARCAVCDKTSGSVRRLQDWRCLWCKAVVSTTTPFPKLLPPIGAGQEEEQKGATEPDSPRYKNGIPLTWGWGEGDRRMLSSLLRREMGVAWASRRDPAHFD